MFHSKSIKIERHIKVIGKLILLCAGMALFIAGSVSAATLCTADKTHRFYSQMDIKLDANLKVNEHVDVMRVTVDYKCERHGTQPNEIYFQLDEDGSSIPGRPFVYRTNLQGVGLAYKKLDTPSNNCRADSQNSNNIMPNYVCQTQRNDPAIISFSYQISVVKLDSNTEAGQITQGPNFHYNYYLTQESQNKQILPEAIPSVQNMLNNLRILGPSCTVDNPTLNFNFGEKQLSDFNGIDSKGPEIQQNITLTCDPKARYSLQVDGIPDPSSKPGVLQLTPGTGKDIAATGIGVQLLLGTQQDPVIFSVPKLMGTAAPGTSNTKETIPMTVRYYQTADKVTPGTANANATFTMTYQ